MTETATDLKREAAAVFFVSVSNPNRSLDRWGIDSLFVDSHLLEQTVCMPPLVHEIDYIAHVNADATGEYRIETDVA